MVSVQLMKISRRLFSTFNTWKNNEGLYKFIINNLLLVVQKYACSEFKKWTEFNVISNIGQFGVTERRLMQTPKIYGLTMRGESSKMYSITNWVIIANHK